MIHYGKKRLDNFRITYRYTLYNWQFEHFPSLQSKWCCSSSFEWWSLIQIFTYVPQICHQSTVHIESFYWFATWYILMTSRGYPNPNPNKNSHYWVKKENFWQSFPYISLWTWAIAHQYYAYDINCMKGFICRSEGK